MLTPGRPDLLLVRASKRVLLTRRSARQKCCQSFILAGMDDLQGGGPIVVVESSGIGRGIAVAVVALRMRVSERLVSAKGRTSSEARR